MQITFSTETHSFSLLLVQPLNWNSFTSADGHSFSLLLVQPLNWNSFTSADGFISLFVNKISSWVSLHVGSSTHTIFTHAIFIHFHCTWMCKIAHKKQQYEMFEMLILIQCLKKLSYTALLNYTIYSHKTNVFFGWWRTTPVCCLVIWSLIVKWIVKFHVKILLKMFICSEVEDCMLWCCLYIWRMNFKNRQTY